MKIKVAIVDDHEVISVMLSDYINKSDRYEVAFTATNGKELLEELERVEEKPRLILLDIHMPVLNGYQTMLRLVEEHPDLKVIIFSMDDFKSSIIQYLNMGAKGYLFKGMSSPDLIIECFDSVLDKGSYFPSFITEKMLQDKNLIEELPQWKLTDRQMEFLKLATQSSLSYQEIADKMYLSIKTVENYQRTLFKLFDVKSRPALMLFVQKHNIFGYKRY